MTNEEIIVIEATIRSYKSLVDFLIEALKKPNDFGWDDLERNRLQGKVDGCIDIIRDFKNRIV